MVKIRFAEVNIQQLTEIKRIRHCYCILSLRNTPKSKSNCRGQNATLQIMETIQVKIQNFRGEISSNRGVVGGDQVTMIVV